ncbi:alpha/beta fold hydrolase [Pedobacter sp. ASV28]|uniref:alpha/beta fold hydrolase n=1 Tax=Pedobacter sp. ASV28 TaxID=2795123 RepID=UPI0018EA923A|nr:alpha/beta hydrolase [Pedobacter sp. ASV28]
MIYHFLRTTHTEIAYARKNKNSSKSIIFVHPSSACSEIWSEIVNNDQLKSYDLICIDTPGHGKSAHCLNPQQDYQLESLSSSILEVINALEVKNYIIVAASLGTNIIGETAHLLKDCKGFFLIGPTLVGGAIEPEHILLPFKYAGVLLEAQPEDAHIDAYMSHLVNSSDQSLLNQLKKYYLQTDPKFRERLASSIGNKQWNDELGNIKRTEKKVAMLYGEDEKISRPDAFLTTDLHQWQNKIHVVKKAGHLIHLDQPEVFIQLLLQFTDDILVE